MQRATEIPLIVGGQYVDKALHVSKRYRVVADWLWNQVGHNRVHLRNRVINAFVSCAVGDIEFRGNQLASHRVKPVAGEARIFQNVE